VTARPLLEVVDLRVAWGGVVALDGLSLEVAAGSVTGIIGPNGAGKTTLLDAITGFAPVGGGAVLLDGDDITAWSPQQRARAGLSRTFQSLELFDDLTVADNLAVGRRRSSVAGVLDDLRGRRRHGDAATGTAGAVVLEQLGLADSADRLPPDLSNGQRHLVALARALASSPRLVVLDEPAAGLDPAETAAVGRVVAALPAQGTTVVLVDHDMDLVLGTCDTVHVLDFGSCIASGPPDAVRADGRVRTAYLGTGPHPGSAHGVTP
jgi:branched-chain amino acid transport system ATP-binding protein